MFHLAHHFDAITDGKTETFARKMLDRQKIEVFHRVFHLVRHLALHLTRKMKRNSRQSGNVRAWWDTGQRDEGWISHPFSVSYADMPCPTVGQMSDIVGQIRTKGIQLEP